MALGQMRVVVVIKAPNTQTGFGCWLRHPYVTTGPKLQSRELHAVHTRKHDGFV